MISLSFSYRTFIQIGIINELPITINSLFGFIKRNLEQSTTMYVR